MMFVGVQFVTDIIPRRASYGYTMLLTWVCLSESCPSALYNSVVLNKYQLRHLYGLYGFDHVDVRVEATRRSTLLLQV